MAEKKVKGSTVNGSGAVKTTEKKENMKSAYSDFFKYIGKFRWMILVAVVLSVIGAVLNLIGPGQLSKVTNLIADGMTSAVDLQTVKQIALMLMCLYGLGFVLNYVQGFLMATVSQRITQNMRKDISHENDRLPLRISTLPPQEIAFERVTNDVDTVGR